MSADVLEQAEVAKTDISFGSWKLILQAVASSQLVLWLGLTCLFAALPLFYVKHARLADPDIWWHMRAGEWIVQNHQIPRVDVFSASTLGRPWADYSWLFDVGAYWGIAHFDLVSIIWFEMLMRLAVTAAVFSLVRSLTPRFWEAVALSGVATLAMAWVVPPRPGAFSVLFFVLVLHVLVSAKRKGNPRLLWIIPGLFVLWANIHIEFVTGLFLLGILCLEPFVNRLAGIACEPVIQAERQGWPIFIASLVAVLANPYGPGLLKTIFQYARDASIYDLITEFHAMHFRTINDWAVLLLLMLACFALGRVRPFRPIWGLLLVWSAWMGFRSLREVWLLSILSVAIIAGSHAGEYQIAEKRLAIRTSMRLAVATAVAVILLAGGAIWSVSSQRLLRQAADVFPVGAVSYIHRNHLQGPLLNELSWGGFLIYAVPEIPPAMDGRTNVHTQDEILSALPLWNGEADWQNRPELQQANLIISDHSWRLASLLRGDPRFRVVYEDSTSVLFEAVHPKKQESQPTSERP